MARKLGLYVAPVLMVLIMTPAGAAVADVRSASPGVCKSWVHATSPNAGTGDNNLDGVAATSARNAWAVGEYFVGVDTKTLIEYWNGKSWRVVPSPNAGADNSLDAVYAVSATDAWAAGTYFNGTAGRTLIEHWDGKSWRVVPSPNAGPGSNEITSVRGISAHDIWAAGDAITSYPTSRTVILHWNGKQWRVASSPSMPGQAELPQRGPAAVPVRRLGRRALRWREQFKDAHPALDQEPLANRPQPQRRDRDQRPPHGASHVLE